MKNLFESFAIKDLTLKNKVVMAPLTRSRGKLDGSPADLIIFLFWVYNLS